MNRPGSFSASLRSGMLTSATRRPPSYAAQLTTAGSDMRPLWRRASLLVKEALGCARLAAPMTPSSRDVAVDAARRAGALLLGQLGGPRHVELKTGPTNLVTDMD